MTVGDGWFQYSAGWIAVCAGALTAASFQCAAMTSSSIGSAVIVPYCAFVSLATFTAYTLDRLLVRWSPEDALNRTGAIAWQSGQVPVLVVLSTLSTLGTGGLLVMLWPKMATVARVLLGASALLSVGYSAPLPGVGRLQDVATAAKPILAASIWTVGTAVVPFLLVAAWSPVLPIWVGVAWLLLFANAMLCDALDVAGDEGAQRRTLAVRWGAARTRTVVARALWLFVGLSCVPIAVLTVPVESHPLPGALQQTVEPLGLVAFAFGIAFAGLALSGSARAQSLLRSWPADHHRHLYDATLCIPLVVITVAQRF